MISNDPCKILVLSTAWILCHASEEPGIDLPFIRLSHVLRLIDSFFDKEGRLLHEKCDLFVAVPFLLSVCSLTRQLKKADSCNTLQYLTTLLARCAVFDESDTVELTYRTSKIVHYFTQFPFDPVSRCFKLCRVGRISSPAKRSTATVVAFGDTLVCASDSVLQ